MSSADVVVGLSAGWPLLTPSHTNSTLASLWYIVFEGLFSQLFGLLASILSTTHH